MFRIFNQPRNLLWKCQTEEMINPLVKYNGELRWRAWLVIGSTFVMGPAEPDVMDVDREPVEVLGLNADML